MYSWMLPPFVVFVMVKCSEKRPFRWIQMAIYLASLSLNPGSRGKLPPFSNDRIPSWMMRIMTQTYVASTVTWRERNEALQPTEELSRLRKIAFVPRFLSPFEPLKSWVFRSLSPYTPVI